MRPLLVALLLAGACAGEKEPDAARAWTFPGAGLRRVRVLCTHGVVRAGTGSADHVAVEGALFGTGDLDGLVRRDGDVLVVRRRDDARFEWTLAAPAGLELEVFGKDVAVMVEGAWARLEIRNERGDIAVGGARCGGGRIATRAGSIRVQLDAPPGRDFACESLEGDVSLAVPATFHGSVHLASGPRRLEVAEHPALWTQRVPTGESLNGFVGPRPTQAEYERLHREGNPPPGIWGKAPRGTVAFRLTD